MRCVVVRSTHPATFSAGGDLEGFAADAPLVDKHREIERFPRLFELIGALGKPSICAVNGHCLAGALGLVLACDLVVAGDTATFGTPEITVGLFPFMVMALLARNVGQKKAKEIWFLCRQYGAQEALDMGLVNAVVPLDQLEEETVQWANEILEKSPTAIRFLKAAFNADTDGMAGLQQFAGDATLLYYLTDEAKEGRDAFVQKRKPDFSKYPKFP